MFSTCLQTVGATMKGVGAGNAFSAGFGLALGVMMANCTLPLMTPPEKAKQVILCQKCGNRNPDENRFCNECGRPLYPPLLTTCSKCGATVTATKFCGACGTLLQMQQRKKGRKTK